MSDATLPPPATPQHRLALEDAVEACLEAGEAPEAVRDLVDRYVTTWGEDE